MATDLSTSVSPRRDTGDTRTRGWSSWDGAERVESASTTYAIRVASPTSSNAYERRRTTATDVPATRPISRLRGRRGRDRLALRRLRGGREHRGARDGRSGHGDACGARPRRLDDLPLDARRVR